MDVWFGKTPIEKGSTIDSEMAKGRINIGWSQDYYTLVLYDMTDSRVKYLVINIPGNKINKGSELASYEPPLPPSGSGKHHYKVELYKQGTFIEEAILPKRERMFLETIIKNGNSALTDTFDFYVTNQPFVSFGDVQVKEGQKLSFDTAQKQLSLQWAAQPDRLYTLAIYDMSAPVSPFLHFLAINIPGSDISKGEVLSGYVPPSPPFDSPPHTYYIDVYEQPGKTTGTLVIQRAGYDPTEMANRTGSKLVQRFSFLVESRSEEYEPKKAWLKEESPLPEPKEKFCRCVLDVAGKQPLKCNYEKAWFQKREGKTCYNPYAVCAKSVGTTSRECGKWYDFENIPDDELKAYASLNKIPIPVPYSREKLLNSIYEWKERKYK